MPVYPKHEPDDALFRKQQLEMEERIDNLYKELNDFGVEYKNRQRDMQDEQQGKGAGWRELREHFDEQKVHAAQKRAIMQKREKIDNEIRDLNREIQKLNRQCHPTYNTLDDLEKGQKILNRRIETTSMTTQSEKAIIKEIQTIKNSEPFIRQRMKLQSQIDNLRKQQKVDSEELPALNKVLGEINKRITKVKEDHKEIDTQKESFASQLEQIDNKRTKIRENIAALKKDKNTAKEAYYQQMIDFEVEQKMIKDIVWLEKTKAAFLERKARNEKYKEERHRRELEREAIKKEREEREKRR